MLKFSVPTTAIRIKGKISTTVNANGFPTDTYADIIDEDILVQWQNKFGAEVFQAASMQAQNAAAIRMWYIPGVTATCKIVRVDDDAEFEIIGDPDDVMNRHQQLEIQVKQWTRGR